MRAKDDRLFAPFPIEMDEHPKIIGLSDAAFRAVFEATFYSRRMTSDGFLDQRIVLRKWGKDVADELSSNDPERPTWIPVENGWQIHDFEKHHPLRAEIEAKRSTVSNRRSEAGKAGASKRWADKQVELEWQTDGKGDGKPMASDSSETAPVAKAKQKDYVQPPAPPVPVIDVEFDQWWLGYPRKQGKEPARKAFTKARKTTSLKVLMDGVSSYALANIGVDKSLVKLPAGWLNDRRWGDEAIVTTPGALPLAPWIDKRPTVSGVQTEQSCPQHGYPLPCPFDHDGRSF